MTRSAETWDDPAPMWVGGDIHKDSHAGFRGRLSLDGAQTMVIRVFASCPFLLYVDGVWIGEGPNRWSISAPTYQEFELHLLAGEHVVAVLGHYEAVSTRMMEAQPPFIACSAIGKSLAWLASGLPGYTSEVRRINPQFGWIDWADTREIWEHWHTLGLDDSKWSPPVKAAVPAQKPVRSAVSFPLSRIHTLQPIRQGEFVESFGYDGDEPQAQFFLRDLMALHGPPQGAWRRYDLGRVRLGRPVFQLDLPSGAVVEFALSESLAHGRVSPWITLSAGPSANMDRYVARGGAQEFTPLTVKAGRFLEVHIRANPKQVRFLAEHFGERSYNGEPLGSFHCSDGRLGKIWSTGVDTYRACSEDSVIDNPTRERGEWIGDTLTVGLENAAAAYSDLTLFRQALRQAAECARADGLVAGLCPGTVGYLSTYACHWVVAGVRIYEIGGDLAFLRELYPAAKRNMKVFSSALTDQGLSGDLGWAFIDWGYVGNSGPSDMGLNLIYMTALQSMIRWCKLLSEDAVDHIANLARITQAVQAYLSAEFAKPDPLKSIGLQSAVLALRADVVDKQHVSPAVQFIKNHYKSCFPNDPFAPHLADPSTAQARLITPFFSHFALTELWEHGEAEFVLDQYRSCWGWALDQGLTTWPEVFDLRWSHCHQWSGCPTWQLSRYVLGISPRRDLGDLTFVFSPKVTSLRSARGSIPIAGTQHTINVEYRRDGDHGRWTVETKTPITIIADGKRHEVTDRFEYPQ